MVDQENQVPRNKPTYQEGKTVGKIKSGISQTGAAQAIGCSCGVLSLKCILLHKTPNVTGVLIRASTSRSVHRVLELKVAA